MHKFLLCCKLVVAAFLFNIHTTSAQLYWDVLGNESQIATATSNYTSLVTITEWKRLN